MRMIDHQRSGYLVHSKIKDSCQRSYYIVPDEECGQEINVRDATTTCLLYSSYSFSTKLSIGAGLVGSSLFSGTTTR